MAISRVQAFSDIGTGTGLEMPFVSDVTAGNLIVFCTAKYFAGEWRQPVAGDLTKTSGTATIGTVTLDKYWYLEFGGGPSSLVAAIFSVPVTGTGSLTLTVDFVDTCTSYASASEYAGADLSASRVNDTADNTGNSADPYFQNQDIPAGGVGVAVLARRGEEDIELSIVDGHWDEIGERDGASSQPLTAGSADELSAGGVSDDAMYWDGPSGNNYWVAVAASYNPTGGVTFTQEGYRWRLDDGSETTATWAAAQDTGITASANTTRRLRVLVDTNVDANAANFQLEYKEANEANWTKVT